MGPRDLVTEGHLAAMGLWNRIGGAIIILVAGLMVVLSLLAAATRGGSGGGVMVAVMTGLAFGLGLGGGLVYWLGSCLAGRSDPARVISGAFSALWCLGSLVNVMQGLAVMAHPGGAARGIGTIIGGGLGLAYQVYMTLVLFSARAALVTSPPYDQAVARDPMAKPNIYGSIFFWLPLLCLAFFGVLVVLVALSKMPVH